MSSDQNAPKPYASWRCGTDREEDAAAVFLHYLVAHCRDKAVQSIGKNPSAEAREAGVRAIDTALHSVVALLEGSWSLSAGEDVSVEFAVSVNALREGRIIESVEIAPGRTDLPIGYWGVVRHGDA